MNKFKELLNELEVEADGMEIQLYDIVHIKEQIEENGIPFEDDTVEVGLFKDFVARLSSLEDFFVAVQDDIALFKMEVEDEKNTTK